MSDRARSVCVRRLMRRAEQYEDLANALEELAGTLANDPEISVAVIPAHLVEPLPIGEIEAAQTVLRALRAGEDRRQSKRVIAAMLNKAEERPEIATALRAAALHVERNPWFSQEAKGLLTWIDKCDAKSAVNILIDFVASENQQERESRIIREANEWHRKQPTDEAITV